MAIAFTKDQEKVILERKKNILVSAAAGSGKTAVLTERIIRLVSEGDEKCDIDRLLVVTFTSAAASDLDFPLNMILDLIGGCFCYRYIQQGGIQCYWLLTL